LYSWHKQNFDFLALDNEKIFWLCAIREWAGLVGQAWAATKVSFENVLLLSEFCAVD